jgi:hypothetical protein
MTAPMTEATFVATQVAAAQARGVSGDGEALARIRADARDAWENNLNQSYSGSPRGSTASN